VMVLKIMRYRKASLPGVLRALERVRREGNTHENVTKIRGVYRTLPMCETQERKRGDWNYWGQKGRGIPTPTPEEKPGTKLYIELTEESACPLGD